MFELVAPFFPETLPIPEPAPKPSSAGPQSFALLDGPGERRIAYPPEQRRRIVAEMIGSDSLSV